MVAVSLQERLYGDRNSTARCVVSPEDHPGVEELMGSREADPAMTATPSEDFAVRDWKTAQLTRLGLPWRVATLFADAVDWHQLEDLLRRGCPLGLALDITR